MKWNKMPYRKLWYIAIIFNQFLLIITLSDHIAFSEILLPPAGNNKQILNLLQGSVLQPSMSNLHCKFHGCNPVDATLAYGVWAHTDVLFQLVHIRELCCAAMHLNQNTDRNFYLPSLSLSIVSNLHGMCICTL